MVKIQRGAEPHVLASEGREAANADASKVSANLAAFQRGDEKLDFKSTVYGHPTVKEALIEMQYGKCCFCESKITHIAYGDVEHFRPKAAWYCSAIKDLVRPGYFWLAYSWENLLFCCQVCNQRYKRNHFPLNDESARCIYPNVDVTSESPLYVNPVEDNPASHMAFRGDALYAVGGLAKGVETIDGLQLNRKDLRLRRSERLEPLKLVYQISNGDIPSSLTDQQNAKDLLARYSDPSAEYSEAVRSAIASGFKYV